MESMARNFFRQLYTADPRVSSTELVQLFEPKVTEEDNVSLCKEFFDEEISDALFQIGPIKAPGPDGFHARFIQRNWEFMKSDVIKGVKNFFETGHMPPGVNEMAIVLIPPKEDFWPIFLCNVIYKVVAKCLVNRLRPLLQELIEPMQSAFIPGRMITDNALIAFECLHAIKNGNRGCRKFGAYDRVDWGYLEGVLKRLGFHSKWVQWIMECVTTVWYSVRFNNVPLESFKPTCDLRQGDPLSSYLFLFVADGLSKVIQRKIQ
jgi:hypothetical protein